MRTACLICNQVEEETAPDTVMFFSQSRVIHESASHSVCGLRRHAEAEGRSSHACGCGLPLRETTMSISNNLPNSSNIPD